MSKEGDGDDVMNSKDDREASILNSMTGTDALAVLKSLLKDRVLSSDQIKFQHSTLSSSHKFNTNGAKTKKTKAKEDDFTIKNNKKKQKKLAFETPTFPENTRFRHVALRFHYDGSTYSGFTENVNTDSASSSKNQQQVLDDNSVEKQIFAALQKTHLIRDRYTCNYSRCGRTDRGVSSFGQVIALKVKSAFPLNAKQKLDRNDVHDDDDDECITSRVDSLPKLEDKDLPKNSVDHLECTVPCRPKKIKIKKSSTADKAGRKDESATAKQNWAQRNMTELNYPMLLNNVLPSSIRVLGWAPVSPDFSARFSCSSRKYRYFFIQRDLNMDKMKQAIDKLVGRHDFRNFCKMNCEQVYNFERVIYSARIVTVPSSSDDETITKSTTETNSKFSRNGCYFEIEGQAFLWHQIRCIVSVLFMVGKELEGPEIVDQLFDIENNPGKPSYSMAPDLPLVLHNCGFHHVKFGHTAKNLWRTMCDLEEKWEELFLSSERVLDGINSLQEEALVRKSDVISYMKEMMEDMLKKEKRRISNGNVKHFSDVDKYNSILKRIEKENGQKENAIMTWGEALVYIKSVIPDLRPGPEGPKANLHTPLMDRSKGTTFEEKVKAILGNDDEEESSKRRERYQENIIKKRKTSEEDKAFYEFMLKQGGNGV